MTNKDLLRLLGRRQRVLHSDCTILGLIQPKGSVPPSQLCKQLPSRLTAPWAEQKVLKAVKALCSTNSNPVRKKELQPRSCIWHWQRSPPRETSPQAGTLRKERSLPWVGAKDTDKSRFFPCQKPGDEAVQLEAFFSRSGRLGEQRALRGCSPAERTVCRDEPDGRLLLADRELLLPTGMKWPHRRSRAVKGKSQLAALLSVTRTHPKCKRAAA